MNNSPNAIVKDMYLQITNIAQGVNLAALVIVVTTENFKQAVLSENYSPYLFALASFLIVIIFWIRYYFDTEILNRSYTIVSAIWFFSYVAIQGLSIGFIPEPHLWMVTTGFFLFFGAGFYWLNLQEIDRKEKVEAITINRSYKIWQKSRLIELSVLSVLSISGALLVYNEIVNSFIAGILVLIFAFWQVIRTGDYRKYEFIDAGV